MYRTNQNQIMDLTNFFCEIDDFCQDWLATFSSTLFPAQGNNLGSTEPAMLIYL